MTDLRNLKKKGIFSRQSTFDAKNQNALDSLLRQQLPVLVQFKTSLAVTQTKSLPADSHRIILDTKFIPDGIEDGAILGKQTTIMAVWKKGNNVFIFRDDNLYKVDTEPEIEIEVSKTKITINNKVPHSTSIKPLLTESALSSMLKNNTPMFLDCVNIVDKTILTKDLLRTACLYGPAECVGQVLDKSGINVETVIAGITWTPLQWAAMNGREDVVSLLVQQYGAHLDSNVGDVYDYTPLGWAIGSNHLATVQCLVELGAGRGVVQGVPSVASMKLLSGSIVNPGVDNREEIYNYLRSKGIQWW